MKQILHTLGLSISMLLATWQLGAQEHQICGTDTVILHVGNYRYGSIQWQKSHDAYVWHNIDGNNDLICRIVPDGRMFYRAILTVPGCTPVYSEVTLLEMPINNLPGREDFILGRMGEFLPKEIIVIYRSYFETLRCAPDYESCLDSIGVAVENLRARIMERYAPGVFDSIAENALARYHAMAKGIDEYCIGLGYAKGIQVVSSSTGQIPSSIAASLQSAGGGGVKIIYDFTNLDRQIYHYSYCSKGIPFGSGFVSAASASTGFTGLGGILWNIRPHGPASGENKFSGAGLASKESATLGNYVLQPFGVDESLVLNFSTEAISEMEGWVNCIPCPPMIQEDLEGVNEVTFQSSVSLNAQIAIGLGNVGVNDDKIGVRYTGVPLTYRKFSSNKKLAALEMAEEMVSPAGAGLAGLLTISSDFDIAGVAVAILESTKDYAQCPPAGLASLYTKAVTNISKTNASCGGFVEKNGGTFVGARGIVWKTSPNPTVSSFHGKTLDGQGNGEFVSSLTGLSAYTTYFVRSYATNGMGTTYGQQVSFTTLPEPPTLVTSQVSGVTPYDATCGGTITAQGSLPITQRGICRGTSPDPDITGYHTLNGSGTGSFTSTLAGLDSTTTYYIRAYATNSMGTVYGNQVIFTTYGTVNAVPCPGMPTLIDYNGNVYNTVQIGNQCWMKDNLRAQRYRNGTAIPLETTNAWAYKTTPAYCWYQNDSANHAIPYGALYNWFCTIDTNGLCPTGWHVPTHSEWTLLANTLGGFSVAGAELKAPGWMYWQNPNFAATNSSGFTAVGSGYRTSGSPPSFWSILEWAYFWTNTSYNTLGSWGPGLSYSTGALSNSIANKKTGYSVRCIRDY